MKHKLSILCISFASMIFLVVGILPHHHHEGMPCIIMDVCDGEDSDCEEEHPHHDTSETDHQNHTCLAKTKFIVTDDENKASVFACKFFSYIDLFFVGNLFTDFVIYNELTGEIPDGDFSFFYQSPDTSHTNGLRAPPFFLI